jgi:FixJ family two-component response regulator
MGMTKKQTDSSWLIHGTGETRARERQTIEREVRGSGNRNVLRNINMYKKTVKARGVLLFREEIPTKIKKKKIKILKKKTRKKSGNLKEFHH